MKTNDKKPTSQSISDEILGNIKKITDDYCVANGIPKPSEAMHPGSTKPERTVEDILKPLIQSDFDSQFQPLPYPTPAPKHTPRLTVQAGMRYKVNDAYSIAEYVIIPLMGIRGEKPKTLEDISEIAQQINDCINEYDKLKADREVLLSALKELLSVYNHEKQLLNFDLNIARQAVAQVSEGRENANPK